VVQRGLGEHRLELLCVGKGHSVAEAQAGVGREQGHLPGVARECVLEARVAGRGAIRQNEQAPRRLRSRHVRRLVR